MEINYKLAAYIMLSAAIGIYGVMFFFKSQKTIAAVLYLILSILIFLFFGLRWFGDKASSNAPKSWPPIINSCPDYLTAYTRTVNGQKIPTCIDLLGVSTGSYGSNGVVRKWDSSMSITNPPTSDEYYFDPRMPTATVAGESPYQQLCTRTKLAGLTWEGICDGENCFDPTVPGSTSGSSGTAGCPASA